MVTILALAEIATLLAALGFGIVFILRFRRTHGTLLTLFEAAFRYHTPDAAWRDPYARLAIGLFILNLLLAILRDTLAA